MQSDSDIKAYVTDELQWQPGLNARDIGVSVDKGVVSLTGYVQAYSQKLAAETAAKKVAGVRGLANDIEVRIPDVDARPDPDIARDVVAAIRLNLPLNARDVRTTVKNGWVTFEGQLEWNFERQSADNAARHIKGVLGITNLIALKPRLDAANIKSKIEAAFKRSAEVDGDHVMVSTAGGAVTLTGTVKSWAERDEADRVAWMAPGVSSVDDRITVSN